MSVLVVDTDVTSFIFRADPLGQPYIPLLEGHHAVLSFMSLAELALWPLRSRWGHARQRKLREFLDENFAICFVDEDLCGLWADIRYQGFAKGLPVSPQDAWIAATARYLDSALVTHNHKHYKDIDGIRVITVAM